MSSTAVTPGRSAAAVTSPPKTLQDRLSYRRPPSQPKFWRGQGARTRRLAGLGPTRRDAPKPSAARGVLPETQLLIDQKTYLPLRIEAEQLYDYGAGKAQFHASKWWTGGALLWPDTSTRAVSRAATGPRRSEPELPAYKRFRPKLPLLFTEHLFNQIHNGDGIFRLIQPPERQTPTTALRTSEVAVGAPGQNRPSSPSSSKPRCHIQRSQQLLTGRMT